MENKVKIILSKVWNIFTYIIMGVSLLIMIFTIFSSAIYESRDASFFGYRAYVVKTDSMSDTFNANDVIICKKVDPSSLEEGDIITFISMNNDESYGQNITHKIRRLTETVDGAPGFITYGTTTNVDDKAIVTYNYVLGEYCFAIKGFGEFMLFLKSPIGYVFVILIPFLLLLISQLIHVVKAYKAYKNEQNESIDNKKKELLEQEEMNRKLLEELEEMKKQLEKMSSINDQSTKNND